MQQYEAAYSSAQQHASSSTEQQAVAGSSKQGTQMDAGSSIT